MPRQKKKCFVKEMFSVATVIQEVYSVQVVHKHSLIKVKCSITHKHKRLKT